MLRFQLRVLSAQPLNLQLLRPHLAVAGKGPAKLSAMVTNLLAQNVDVEIQVACRLPHRHAAIPDQFYRLELELAAKLASLHSEVARLICTVG